MSTTDAAPSNRMFDETLFGRNYINGQWVFPKAPYEFECRSSSTSEVIGVVPLSSQLDVAKAVKATHAALPAWTTWSSDNHRLATALVETLTVHRTRLIEHQSSELGVSRADSSALFELAIDTIEATVRPVGGHPPGVEGHILGWGFPVLEFALTVAPTLLAGSAVVAKPSLRAPLTWSSLCAALDQIGLPPGVFNLVHGQGSDVGAAMIADDGIPTIVVRGGATNTRPLIASALRRGRTVRATYGAVERVVVGPDADVDIVALTLAARLCANDAGGPRGLDHIHMHSNVAASLLAALDEALIDRRPAPVITDAYRRHALGAIASALTGGARLLTGGPFQPDDRRHRMGWHMVPTLIDLAPGQHPLIGAFRGPVASVSTWSSDEGQPRPNDVDGWTTFGYDDGSPTTPPIAPGWRSRSVQRNGQFVDTRPDSLRGDRL
jgi:acyl-CoA reductase-like NAD-dependent aldehyde dehydrogenase